MSRLVVVLLVAAVAAVVFGREPLPSVTPSGARGLAPGGFRAVQESLSRVHPKMRASWLRERRLDGSYYTTFHRPESTGLKCIGRWPWGPSWELAGKDTFLYLGSGSGVRILSIADSVHPRMLGQINARSLVSQVVVQDTLLFVACGSWGAQVYSVADPARPRELGSMDEVIVDLCVKGSLCYAVGGDNLRIYDLADVQHPVGVGGIVRVDGDVVLVANGHAFVGGPGSLDIYDVTDPSNPTWVNSLGGPTYDMFLRRNLLFCSRAASPTRLSIFNVVDPMNITEVGRLDGIAGDGLYANDSFAYLSGLRDRVGLFVVDVSDSSRPTLRDSIDPEGFLKRESYVPRPGSYGYVADDFGGLVALDLHNADSIFEAWSGYKAHSAVDVSIDGQRAYIANDLSGLQIVDVADPMNPVSLGIFDTVGTRQTFTTQARDSFAFIGWWGNDRRFLRVLDVTDPTSPVFAAEESCFNPPQDIVLKDTFIYAAEPYEFQVFNVARPREPVLVGSCASTDGNLFGLAVQDSFAYEASQYGMWVINVARPDSPFVVSSGIGLNAAGIAVRDTFVYLPYVYDTLLTYSAANPALPRLLSSVRAGVWPSDIALGGSRGYVALNGAEGVETFDLTNPASPVSRGQTSAPFAVREVRYSSGLVYACMWDAGVAIYETTAVGIAEPRQVEGKQTRKGASVVRGVLFLEDAPSLKPRAASWLLDVSGRKVLDLHPGANDVRALAPGVYFVRQALGVKRDASDVTKVIITQ